MAEEKHFYGGQAIMRGVMMRGTDSWGAAVQREDGTIAVISQPIWDLTHRFRWAKWPLIRGNVALVDTLVLGLKSLIFSFNVLVEEQQELERKAVEAAEAETTEPASGKKKAPKKQSDMGWAAWGAMIPSLLLGLGLFILLPAALVKMLLDDPGDVAKNLVEGGVRLVIILGYVSAISALKDIRLLFQYHGAEHATINCHEAGEPVTLENCVRYSALHPRCGTAFLLVFIVVKILVGAVLPYPDVLWQLMALRILMIPIVAAIAYEIIRYGGRHRHSILSRVLAQPGMLMQRLTTRQASPEQIRVAIYALATVAPEVPLPESFTPGVPATVDGKLTTAELEQAPAASE